MGLFGHKKKEIKDDDIRNNKYEIQEMADSIEILIAGIKDEAIKTHLVRIEDKIRYFNPSADSRVLDVDKKIRAAIGDVKIEIMKGVSDSSSEKINNLLLSLDMLIPEREAYAKSKINR